MRVRWILLLVASLLSRHVCAAEAEQEKINTAVDALTRLEGVDLQQKPAIKAAVERLLQKTRGTPQFVRLVDHFKLTGQEAGLIEVAKSNPDSEAGVGAMRLVLSQHATNAILSALATTNTPEAARLVRALGNTKEKQAAPLVLPLVTNATEGLEVRRAAVHALAQTEEGAEGLLSLARRDEFPDQLKFSAASELNSARWPQVKAQAATVLPLPVAQNAEPLPPVAELVKMKGDPARGAQVFQREATGCSKCHEVRGQGRDVGPALSEIGTKLAREALYEAILDPSAGISFGFEAWQVQLKSGDEVYGLKVSETADEVAIKDTNAIVTRYKRTDIQSMQQGKTSIMPAGLQATMTTQDLVDLVEYLASLKKTGP